MPAGEQLLEHLAMALRVAGTGRSGPRRSRGSATAARRGSARRSRGSIARGRYLRCAARACRPAPGPAASCRARSGRRRCGAAPVGDGAKRTRMNMPAPMLIGAHVSNAGGLAKAVERGAERGCQAIQIFNQSPRMWRPTAYAEDDFAEFREAIKATEIKARADPRRLPAQLRLRGQGDPREVARVADPVAARRRRDRRRRRRAPPRLGQAGRRREGDQARGQGDQGGARRVRGCPLHLEDTAGAGGTLGRSFEELARAAATRPAAATGSGLCLDSCHLLASGYDVRTPRGPDRDARRSSTGSSASTGCTRCTSTTR